MRLLLDVGISVVLAAILRGHGHDVVHVLDSGLATLSDRDILRLAIVTHQKT